MSNDKIVGVGCGCDEATLKERCNAMIDIESEAEKIVLNASGRSYSEVAAAIVALCERVREDCAVTCDKKRAVRKDYYDSERDQHYRDCETEAMDVLEEVAATIRSGGKQE
jgi:hypothetical protein